MQGKKEKKEHVRGKRCKCERAYEKAQVGTARLRKKKTESAFVRYIRQT